MHNYHFDHMRSWRIPHDPREEKARAERQEKRRHARLVLFFVVCFWSGVAALFLMVRQ